MPRPIAVLLLLCAQASLLTGQSSAPVQSPILGIALPAGTKASSNFLYRSAARAAMQIDAKKAGITLGDPLELYRFTMPGPSQAELVALVQGAGWRVAIDSAAPTWGVAEKGGERAMLSFEFSPRDRWLYVARIASQSSDPIAAPATAERSPAGEPTVPAEQPVAASPAAAESPRPPAAPPGQRGFTFTTSNFDDGWVATAQPDYVLVRKGDVFCYLFYRVPMTEQMRPPATVVADYFWRRDVLPRYTVLSEDRRRQDLTYSQVEYIEGDATDRATGQRVYVGMNVNRDNAGALNIVIVAPDQATYRRMYPHPDDLEKMVTYNKFAVAPADLVGHWDETSSGMSQMYYVNTGNYAGMNLNTGNSQFFIEPDGTYLSKHVGAMGMVGSTRVYSDNYKGQYRMNGNWQVTFTNRFGGRSETFAAQFELVKGGRILHLMNVAATGIRYHLGLVQ